MKVEQNFNSEVILFFDEATHVPPAYRTLYPKVSAERRNCPISSKKIGPAGPNKYPLHYNSYSYSSWEKHVPQEVVKCCSPIVFLRWSV